MQKYCTSSIDSFRDDFALLIFRQFFSRVLIGTVDYAFTKFVLNFGKELFSTKAARVLFFETLNVIEFLFYFVGNIKV
jgi:hypothetical protein